MPAYDSEAFDPPAPLARVSLRSPENGSVVDNVPMLIDSGADVTLIPEMFLSELGIDLDQGESYELTAFDGQKSTTRSVRLELVFQGRTFRGLFLLNDGENGILGRNVINNLALVLDGPRLTWNEPASASKH
jgi:hypothetical protein